jgi:hypothetical protein
MEEKMQKPKALPVLAALLIAALAGLTGAGTATAKPKNITGTYSCNCLMDTGTCDMIVESGRVRCGRSGSNPCQSSCRLDTTTSGLKGGAAAIKSGAAKMKAK